MFSQSLEHNRVLSYASPSIPFLRFPRYRSYLSDVIRMALHSPAARVWLVLSRSSHTNLIAAPGLRLSETDLNSRVASMSTLEVLPQTNTCL